jgi:hypothetical protein
MGIRSRAKLRADALKLNNLTGRSPGGGQVQDLRTPKVTMPLSRTRKKGFG